MEKIVFCIVGLLIFSGCVTTEEIKEIEIQQLREKISYLEDQLKQKEEENFILKRELEERGAELERKEVESEERVVVKMPDAKQIQTALKNAGFYDGEIDGVIGPKTKEAIQKFQERNDLSVDGVVGSRTWEKLKEYLDR